MPPAPIGATISYGPICVPGVRGIRVERYIRTKKPALHSGKSEQIGEPRVRPTELVATTNQSLVRRGLFFAIEKSPETRVRRADFADVQENPRRESRSL
jgi:hypothetical protein